MAGFLDGIRQAVAGVREESYPKARNAVAEALLQPGGKGTHQTAKDYFHRKGSYALTKRLGSVLPPQVAANLADSAYLGNEAVTGVLAKLAGQPYFSDYGFRWGDVALNRQGQDEAVKELETEKAASGWKRKADFDALLGRVDKEGF